MNNNLQNQSPENKGHLRKLSAEQLDADKARQPVLWNAYANMHKAVELSYQSSLTALRQAQPEVIQNVAGVAIANESIQKADPYAETQQVFAQPEMPVSQIASAPAENAFTGNPLLQQVGTTENAGPAVEDPVSAAERIVREAYDSMQGVQ